MSDHNKVSKQLNSVAEDASSSPNLKLPKKATQDAVHTTHLEWSDQELTAMLWPRILSKDSVITFFVNDGVVS
jgi:hypothetical protein